MSAPRSLRWRLLAATLAGVALATLLAGLALDHLLRAHVRAQFESALSLQLDQVTARLDFDPTGQPSVDIAGLSDPRWQQPYAGLYWQLDALPPGGAIRPGVLRSRSLWDMQLRLRAAAVPDGRVHVHEALGPRGEPVLALDRIVRAEASGMPWRLIVAGDLAAQNEALAGFRRVLAACLLVLVLLLGAAAWAQVAVGLRPLAALRRSLAEVQHGQAARLQGRFPAEVQRLVADFNQVLEGHAQLLERARTQAGNLAHALKTPLSVLEQAARTHSPELPQLVLEQVALARRHVDWHLAHARMAAVGRIPGQRSEVGESIAQLLRVMERIHAERGLLITPDLPESPLYFAGEAQDLQEMLGNLLDNACQWAAHRVVVQAGMVPGALPMLRIVVSDDGPGIPPDQLRAAAERGVRLDERSPGSGLGLAIVQELAGQYGGSLELRPGEGGGLQAVVQLPAAPTPAGTPLSRP